MYQVHCSNYTCILQNLRHEFTNLNKVSSNVITGDKSQNINNNSGKKINQNFETNLKIDWNMNQSAKNVLEARLESNYTSHW